MDDILIAWWNKLPAPIRNRYFLTAVAFVAFMVFIDKHDVLTQISLQRTVDQLEQDSGFYRETIDHEMEVKLDMEVNRERFARENYFMQRDNEDVFIIIDENE